MMRSAAILGLLLISLAALGAQKSGNLSVTVVPGGNYGNYLIGYDQDFGDIANALGGNPMIVGCGNIDCAPEPMHYGLHQMDDQSQAAAAAANTLTGQWESEYFVNRVDPAGPYTYFIRVCSEWQGSTACGPFVNGDENQGEAIDPATWIAGVRNFVDFVRADPNLKNVKIGFDVPYTPEQAKYYPGDDYVDIITYDMYPGLGQGPTSQAAWDWEITGPLAAMMSYGKPMAVPEFCEKFADGYVTTQLAQWANTQNVVALVFWNQNGLGNPATGEVNCNIDSTPAKLNAFMAAWYGYKYTGSFWPVIIPWQ
jgi:hypothetical protein